MGFYERIDARGVRETGRPVSFVPKGALTHHPRSGRWYCLRQPCALRGGCGSCGSLMDNATTLRCCCHCPRSRLTVSLHSKKGCRRKSFCTYAACPHKAATGSFICGYGYRFPQYPFSFCEKETKSQERKDGENEWRFTTWKPRWSAGVRDGLPWQLPLI